MAAHGTDLSGGATGESALSVVIPTYGRDRILTDTCRALFALSPAPREIVLVDQTVDHDAETRALLAGWDREGAIRWLRLEAPSIARAMNTGLLAATGDIVLFLDDDIVPDGRLLAAHGEAHDMDRAEVVAGRVIQPWDDPDAGGRAGADELDFTGRQGRYCDQFMGGNVSMRRDVALQTGGVDERFVQVAYRFEREWADRFVAAGHRIWYEPGACIEHLKAGSGGTRSYGRRALNPGHGVGEYYYLLRSPRVRRRGRGFGRRLYQATVNRYHLRRPWLLPVTAAVEVVAMTWAAVKWLQGPMLVEVGTIESIGNRGSDRG